MARAFPAAARTAWGVGLRGRLPTSGLGHPRGRSSIPDSGSPQSNRSLMSLRFGCLSSYPSGVAPSARIPRRMPEGPAASQDTAD